MNCSHRFRNQTFLACSIIQLNYTQLDTECREPRRVRKKRKDWKEKKKKMVRKGVWWNIKILKLPYQRTFFRQKFWLTVGLKLMILYIYMFFSKIIYQRRNIILELSNYKSNPCLFFIKNIVSYLLYPISTTLYYRSINAEHFNQKSIIYRKSIRYVLLQCASFIT